MAYVSRENQQQRCSDSPHHDWPEFRHETPNLCERDPELEALSVRVDLDPALTELIDHVRAAASALEGQGAKSDRIATQLLTALARFHLRVGRP